MSSTGTLSRSSIAKPLNRIRPEDVPPEDCVFYNDNEASRALLAELESRGITIEQRRYLESDPDALPIMKVSGSWLGPGDPAISNWLIYLEWESSQER